MKFECAVSSVIAGARGIMKSLARSRLVAMLIQILYRLDISFEENEFHKAKKATIKCGIHPLVFQQVKAQFCKV